MDPTTGKLFDILTLEEYKNKIGFPDIPNTTIHYQMQQDNLDFVLIGRYHHIIFNEKAQNYCPGKNYGKRWKTKEE